MLAAVHSVQHMNLRCGISTLYISSHAISEIIVKSCHIFHVYILCPAFSREINVH